MVESTRVSVPPRSCGVVYAVMQPVNTSTEPVTRPDTLSGRVTRRKLPSFVEPRLSAASVRSSGMLSMTPISDRIMSGRKSCMKPMVMENSL